METSGGKSNLVLYLDVLEIMASSKKSVAVGKKIHFGKGQLVILV